MPSYAERLAEFNRVTGRLRRCAPTCDFPDQPHEVTCPELPTDVTLEASVVSAGPGKCRRWTGPQSKPCMLPSGHTGGHLSSAWQLGICERCIKIDIV